MVTRWLFALIVCSIVAFHGPASAEEISVKDRLEQISTAVHDRLQPYFRRQRIEYPPARLALVAIKDEKRLKVYAQNPGDDSWSFIMQYQVAKLSGKPGPKLKSGDKQVPEGIYRVTHLNPMSKFWLSLALDYPNEFDRRMARKDDRSSLGGDIMLHGWWFSEGCVAVGNTASEDLFVLAHDVGLDHLKVIIAPTDFRLEDKPKLPSKPGWVTDLYENLEDELNTLGSDGLTTDTRLVAYNDIAPPPAPKPSLFEAIMKALADAAETSGTKDSDAKKEK